MSTQIEISDIIAQAIERQGGNKSEIGRKIGISSQLLGQYAKGPKKPGLDFFAKWKMEFKEDLYREIETKVYNLPVESNVESGQVEASLASLLAGQNEIRAQIKTIHQWDAQTYAQGDEEKEKQAVEHIGKLYASNLLEYQKKGIGRLVMDK